MSRMAPLLAESLQRVHIMMKPPKGWMTKRVRVSTEGNPEMQALVQNGITYAPGSGEIIIQNLANIYKKLGLNVLLFENSQAEARVTERIIGSPNPDGVFTVDSCTGHNLEGGGYVNIINRMTASTRKLETYVMLEVARLLGAENVKTQNPGEHFEGGDFGFSDHGLPGAKSLLITGGGANSRSNPEGHAWLRNTLKPSHELPILSTEYHRDLVSVIVQNVKGEIACVLLATECITNKTEVISFFQQFGIPVIQVPKDAVSHCAVNLLVQPGLLVGMQSHRGLVDILHRELPVGIKYHALREDVRHLAEPFTALAGGANCVTGSLILDPDNSDTSQGNVARINERLHSKDFEDYLQAAAEEIGMKEAVDAARAEQLAAQVA